MLEIQRKRTVVTFEEVCCKLDFIYRAVVDILSDEYGEPSIRDEELVGLQNIFIEALDELRAIEQLSRKSGKEVRNAQ